MAQRVQSRIMHAFPNPEPGPFDFLYKFASGRHQTALDGDKPKAQGLSPGPIQEFMSDSLRDHIAPEMHQFLSTEHRAAQFQLRRGQNVTFDKLQGDYQKLATLLPSVDRILCKRRGPNGRVSTRGPAQLFIAKDSDVEPLMQTFSSLPLTLGFNRHSGDDVCEHSSIISLHEALDKEQQASIIHKADPVVIFATPSNVTELQNKGYAAQPNLFDIVAMHDDGAARIFTEDFLETLRKLIPSLRPARSTVQKTKLLVTSSGAIQPVVHRRFPAHSFTRLSSSSAHREPFAVSDAATADKPKQRPQTRQAEHPPTNIKDPGQPDVEVDIDDKDKEAAALKRMSNASRSVEEAAAQGVAHGRIEKASRRQTSNVDPRKRFASVTSLLAANRKSDDHPFVASAESKSTTTHAHEAISAPHEPDTSTPSFKESASSMASNEAKAINTTTGETKVSEGQQSPVENQQGLIKSQQSVTAAIEKICESEPRSVDKPQTVTNQQEKMAALKRKLLAQRKAKASLAPPGIHAAPGELQSTLTPKHMLSAVATPFQANKSHPSPPPSVSGRSPTHPATPEKRSSKRKSSDPENDENGDSDGERARKRVATGCTSPAARVIATAHSRVPNDAAASSLASPPTSPVLPQQVDLPTQPGLLTDTSAEAPVAPSVDSRTNKRKSSDLDHGEVEDGDQDRPTKRVARGDIPSDPSPRPSAPLLPDGAALTGSASLPTTTDADLPAQPRSPPQFFVDVAKTRGYLDRDEDWAQLETKRIFTPDGWPTSYIVIDAWNSPDAARHPCMAPVTTVAPPRTTRPKDTSDWPKGRRPPQPLPRMPPRKWRGPWYPLLIVPDYDDHSPPTDWSWAQRVQYGKEPEWRD